MRTHPPAGRLAAGVDDLWPEPFGKPRSRDLTVMGGKAEPATALKSAAERRSSPTPPRRQFGHVTSFLKGWAVVEGSFAVDGDKVRVRNDRGKLIGSAEYVPGEDAGLVARRILRRSCASSDFY